MEIVFVTSKIDKHTITLFIFIFCTQCDLCSFDILLSIWPIFVATFLAWPCSAYLFCFCTIWTFWWYLYECHLGVAPLVSVNKTKSDKRVNPSVPNDRTHEKLHLIFTRICRAINAPICPMLFRLVDFVVDKWSLVLIPQSLDIFQPFQWPMKQNASTMIAQFYHKLPKFRLYQCKRK